jgi:hypothetical protein
MWTQPRDSWDVHLPWCQYPCWSHRIARIHRAAVSSGDDRACQTLHAEWICPGRDPFVESQKMPSRRSYVPSSAVSHHTIFSLGVGRGLFTETIGIWSAFRSASSSASNRCHFSKRRRPERRRYPGEQTLLLLSLRSRPHPVVKLAVPQQVPVRHLPVPGRISHPPVPYSAESNSDRITVFRSGVSQSCSDPLGAP